MYIELNAHYILKCTYNVFFKCKNNMYISCTLYFRNVNRI